MRLTIFACQLLVGGPRPTEARLPGPAPVSRPAPRLLALDDPICMDDRHLGPRRCLRSLLSLSSRLRVVPIARQRRADWTTLTARSGRQQVRLSDRLGVGASVPRDQRERATAHTLPVRPMGAQALYGT